MSCWRVPTEKGERTKQLCAVRVILIIVLTTGNLSSDLTLGQAGARHGRGIEMIFNMCLINAEMTLQACLMQYRKNLLSVHCYFISPDSTLFGMNISDPRTDCLLLHSMSKVI